MKKIKKYKVGIDSETYAISMVDEPAIESDFVALSKQDETEVKLSSDERHMVYGAALIPDKDIYRNNGEQEFYISFTKESIEKMSQDFMKNYRQKEVTLDHDEMANDVTITESWLVEDPYKDKSNALGINVPQGTWMVGMKVNQIDVWERVKSGELRGFSVESMISLEEFSKQNDNNMVNTDEMSFWTKMKEVLREAFGKAEEEEVNKVETEFEEQTTEPSPEPTVAEPTVTEPTISEPVVEEPTVEEPVVEEPTATNNEDITKLQDLIDNLKNEIDALKSMNSGLENKIKDLSKEPSAKPVNTNCGNPNNGGNTYSAWREQMAAYLGR